jgi:tetraacyldisaccharide 4'-kinase
LQSFIFKYHHRYTKKEIQAIIKEFNNHLSKTKFIVTTEKDAQRLKIEPFRSLLTDLPVYYIPIQVAFHKDKECSFDEMALKEIVR